MDESLRQVTYKDVTGNVQEYGDGIPPLNEPSRGYALELP